MLLVDDDAQHTSALELQLWRRGFRVVTAGGADQALALLDAGDVDAVLTDLRSTGLEFSQRVADSHPDLPLIVWTASHGSEATEALRAGAYDFLCKPAPLDAVVISLSRALQQRRLQREVARLRIDGELVTLEEMEKRYVLRVLEALRGNKTAAARTLGIERKTLYRKLETWGVKDPESQGAPILR